MNKENSRCKIAVVDDNELFSRKICQTIQKFWSTGNPALKIYKSGLKLAESIMHISAESYIVFITSYERYALQSIKIGAFYYILKEEYDRELDKVLHKICMEESRKRQTKSFLIGKSSTYEKVCLDDIFYIDRNGKDAGILGALMMEFFYYASEFIYLFAKACTHTAEKQLSAVHSAFGRRCRSLTCF